MQMVALKSASPLFITAFLVLHTFNVYAANAHTGAGDAGGRILDAIEAEQADAVALVAETDVFKSIGMGLSLSIAQCEVLDNCTSIINPTELQTLLNTLDTRINGLIVRQEQGGQDFTELLTAYVDQRENYLRYQEKLEEIVGPELATDATAEGTDEQLDLSVFEDADESIDDLYSDESTQLEDDFNPDAPDEVEAQ